MTEESAGRFYDWSREMHQDSFSQALFLFVSLTGQQDSILLRRMRIQKSGIIWASRLEFQEGLVSKFL